MKILRTSFYHLLSISAGECSISSAETFVVLEKDLTVSAEQYLKDLPRTPGLFSVTEAVDSPDMDLVTATAWIANYVQERRDIERDMAILYYWDAQMLRMLNAGGPCVNTRPAPLTVEQIQVVFEQLKHHPNYTGNTVLTIAKDLTPVQLRAGEISVGRLH